MLVDDLTRAMLESSEDCWSLVKILKQFSFNSFGMKLGTHFYSPMCPCPLSLGINNMRHKCECEFQKIVDVKLGKNCTTQNIKVQVLASVPVSSLLDIRPKGFLSSSSEKANTKILKICPRILYKPNLKSRNTKTSRGMKRD